MCSKKTLDNLEHELQIVISLFFDTVFQRLDSIDMSIYGLDFYPFHCGVRALVLARP